MLDPTIMYKEGDIKSLMKDNKFGRLNAYSFNLSQTLIYHEGVKFLWVFYPLSPPIR